MIAREDAEAAGIVWDRFVKAEFRRKVGDRILDRAAGAGFSIRILTTKIFFEFLEHLFQLARKIFVLGKFFQSGLPRKLQHSYRIMVSAGPQLVIKVPEQAPRIRFPRPPKIETHLSQWLQCRR